MLLQNTFLMMTALALGAAATAQAAQFVDLGGPASGYLAISNAKNGTTQTGVGLPDYPNYQMGTGGGSNWTAIIASPLDSTSDYSDFANFSTGFTGSTFTVSNTSITQSDASTLSAGRIDYNNSLISGSGTETIGVGDLTFTFDTYAWNGITDSGWDTNLGNIDISPFSPIYTPYNDGSGAGNASFYYNISISNLTGTGLTFENGVLDSMDITGDLTVQNTSGINPGLTAAFTGTFTASGLTYTFDVNQQQDFPFVFSDVNMIMNRSGTASVIPEPTTALLLAGGTMVMLRRRRRATTC